MVWYDPRDWGAHAGDVAADALRDVLGQIYQKAIDNPEIIIVPAAVLAGAGLAIGAGTGYGTAYSVTAGALDAAQDRQEGFILPGGIL